jgi:hypothetical protein
MSAGWGTDTISRILRVNGIRVWGVMLSGDMILFATRRKQARFAIYLLQREGIPFASNAPELMQTRDWGEWLRVRCDRSRIG